ncbi:MAG: phosphoribosylformylglycinamidine synthase [Acidobacteria bacterium]|nr:phosphoribosylformylglycinamidine synthase [Acidobacteriota bacterium]
METAAHRIEVFYSIPDARGRVLLEKLQGLGFALNEVRLADNYLLNAELTDDELQAAAMALTQSVTQDFRVDVPFVPDSFDYAIEIGFLPGVTDNVAHTCREMLEDLLGRRLDPEKSIFTSTTYFVAGSLDDSAAWHLGQELYNPLIQRMNLLSRKEYGRAGGMGRRLPVVHLEEIGEVDEVSLDLSGEELLRLGREGIANPDGSRRGPLALDRPALQVIRDYFRNEGRSPTDIELESIAQTWSEHCKHTIFAARLDEIDAGIFKQFIRGATERIRNKKGARDFCESVFTDNAGGILFDENWVIADKVETHNSPSALDPFGGALTGIVGVNRDAMGFGMGAKPVANRYGFCFADPDDRRPLYRSRDEESVLLSPRRIMEGVVHGVNVGGNCSGIPTPQGFVYFHPRYKGKPLVFVGTVGLIPRTINGQPGVAKKAQPGDRVVMVGGRVGRDGIHGATFSSEALSAGSPATAVQIGDPITQKKMSDAIIKEAREQDLYHSITDNGAGGLSCSVAEMARESGGFEVELERVPLKYPGLAPWQIWISESQERMTLAIPPDKVAPFLELMQRRGVEATVIGTFTDSGRGVVRYKGRIVFDLDMVFLHDGLPQKVLHTETPPVGPPDPEFPEPADMSAVFHRFLERLNIASFEFISTQFDHEVQANSVIKPLQGAGRVNGNATVIRPVPESNRGVVLSQGIYPSYSEIDAYGMAACAIDTAIRNAVAVGGTLDRMALLDNFCWCDSHNPVRLAQLKAAAEACYNVAVAYGTPFISGKDSMFNDFRGFDHEFNPVLISVPPTLLISSIGIVPDVRRCQTLDFKMPGDLVYVLGLTAAEWAGSEYLTQMGERLQGRAFSGRLLPWVDPAANARLYHAYEQALRDGLVASAVSLERGGLALAAARSAMAGRFGLTLDLARVPATGALRHDELLYSESQGRLLVTVDPARRTEFETIMGDCPLACVGEVQDNRRFVVTGHEGRRVLESDVDDMLEHYRSRFRRFSSATDLAGAVFGQPES